MPGGRARETLPNFLSENALKFPPTDLKNIFRICTLAQGNNATPRVFSTKTQDFKPMVLKYLVDVHLPSIDRL